MRFQAENQVTVDRSRSNDLASLQITILMSRENSPILVQCAKCFPTYRHRLLEDKHIRD